MRRSERTFGAKHIYTYIFIYMDIYIERERETEEGADSSTELYNVPCHQPFPGFCVCVFFFFRLESRIESN